MTFFFYSLFFLFGLAVGSFLNSIIYRLQTGESFLFKRSYCPHCKYILGWPDLIPVLSFIFLKGKCRYCQQKISCQYPLVELITGILFVIIIFQSSLNLLLTTYYLLLACFLIIIFVYDLKHHIIPDKVIYSAIAIALLYNLTFHFSLFIFHLAAAILTSCFFLAIVLISSGRWLGLGDVKLAAFMGLILGWPNILVGLFLAFFIGAIIGLGLIASGKKTLKSEVPFGPFLVTGIFLAMFWGEKIINWYLNLLI